MRAAGTHGEDVEAIPGPVAFAFADKGDRLAVGCEGGFGVPRFGAGGELGRFAAVGADAEEVAEVLVAGRRAVEDDPPTARREGWVGITFGAAGQLPHPASVGLHHVDMGPGRCGCVRVGGEDDQVPVRRVGRAFVLGLAGQPARGVAALRAMGEEPTRPADFPGARAWFSERQALVGDRPGDTRKRRLRRGNRADDRGQEEYRRTHRPEDSRSHRSLFAGRAAYSSPGQVPGANEAHHAKPAALGGRLREVRSPKRTHIYRDTCLSSLGDPRSEASPERPGQSIRLSRLNQSSKLIRSRIAGQPRTGCAEGSAARTRSATDSPVRPTSARSSAGLPWVT